MFTVPEIISNQARPEDNTQIHTGGKPYECLQCGNHFYVNTTFMNICRHYGEKSHKCLQCEKLFSIQSYFLKHTRTHSDAKPYQCDQCDVAYLYEKLT